MCSQRRRAQSIQPLMSGTAPAPRKGGDAVMAIVSEATRDLPNALDDDANWAQARPQPSSPSVASSRRPAEVWLGQESRQVVVGDPGAGKSTLLRYLVLDLLSDEPAWAT